MTVLKAKRILSVLVAMFLAFTIQTIATVNLAHADNQNLYLIFTPDPKVEQPISKYRVAYWVDGKENTPTVQLFGGPDNGKLNATIRPTGAIGKVNFQIYTTDTEKTSPDTVEQRTWESPKFTGVKLGNTVWVSYTAKTGSEFEYPAGDPGDKQIVDGNKTLVTFVPDPLLKAEEYRLWVWYDGQNGRVEPFTGKDAQGRLTAEITVPKNVTRLNIIVRNDKDGKEWAWQTKNIENLPAPGRVDVKVTGTDDKGMGIVETKVEKDPNAAKAEKQLYEKVQVTLHYRRWDDNYDGWNIWGWVEGKDGAAYQFGDNHTATFTLENKDGVNGFGVIVRKGNWEAKDPDGDLKIPADKIKDGKVELWVASGYKQVYYSAAEAPKAAPKPPKPGACVKLHTKEFNDKYYYDGQLGAIYTPASTTFRVWAPTAEKVEFVNYSKNGSTQLMKSGEKGTWEITLPGDQKGTKYRYRLYFKTTKTNADGKETVQKDVTEAVDPYARAVSANGQFGVVEDANNIAPAGWDAAKRMPKFKSIEDAIIYEAHIRDLTIAPDNGIQHKGKFLGLTETGTKTKRGNPSGLDYLKSLGVTHVQFLPMFDFGSVDETDNLGFDQQYNWGYDPQNYNVPEGSYSSNPADPQARIREMKQMVQTLHKNGLRVIMDVVYNHVHDPAKSPLEQTVPGYYLRMTPSCEYNGDTGVGNATASEQPMMRKYIVDSITYWAKNYNLDGFRFDLMGIHDVETMKAVREALNKIDPSIVILGEGWSMWNNQKPDGVQAADQPNAKKLPGIAFFNDSYRDAMKGNPFNDKNTGFISGANKEQNSWDLLKNIEGAQEVRQYGAPDQSVVYNEAHDNQTVFDRLVSSLPKGTTASEIAKRESLATVTQYLANGAVFIHAGQEFMRTKGGDENSYKSPDSVNRFDYDRAAVYAPYVKMFRDLNRFRKQYDFMRLDNYDEINKRYTHEFAGDSKAKTVETNHVAYRVADAFESGTKKAAAYVYINGDTNAWKAPLPAGKYETLISGYHVYDTPVAIQSTGNLAVPPLSAVLVREAPEAKVNPDAPNPGNTEAVEPDVPQIDDPQRPDPKPENPNNWGSYGGFYGFSSPYAPAKDKKDDGKKKPGANKPVVSKFDKQFTKKVELPKSAVKRASGADRVATSVAALGLAKNHEVVVLATGSNFPDALVGGALAGAFKGGVLLTTGTTLEQSVLDSLKSYKTKTVHIVGGYQAVSAQKEAQLKNAGLEVIRHAGADRYATAQAVKAATLQALGGKSSIACNATGVDFPDALACSSAASQMGGTVDLVKPGQAVAKDATAKTVCAGGSACRAAGNGVEKVVGSDRYETAYKLAGVTPSKGSVLVSNGQSYADSLVAGALAGSLQADLVLAKPTRVNVPADTKTMQLFGGKAVLPDTMAVFTK